jgi:hypothetical protein
LNSLIARHGNLANTFKAAIATGTASYNEVLKIQSRMDDLGEELQNFATAADVSKKFILNIITRV